MAAVEDTFTFEAVLEQDGVKVSKSPWGPDDEIGRLNWITPDTNRAILEHLDGAHLFDLNVEYFIGMPSWVAAGDPPYGIWMTHTPQGSVNDNLSGVGSHVHEKYSYCGDSIHLYTHCGTHVDTLNHLGFYGKFWNGWTADAELGSRIWNKGGLDKYPPIIARGVLLDVAGLHGVDCLPDGYAITPDDLQNAAREQGVEIPTKSVVLVRTGRMTKWPDFDGYLVEPARDRPAGRQVPLRGGRRDVHRRRLDRARGAAVGGARRLPAGARVHVRDGRCADHRGRGHGGDRGREAVRVRVPRLPDEAARRDRRADALLRGAAPRLSRTTFLPLVEDVERAGAPRRAGTGTSTTSEMRRSTATLQSA